MHGQKNSNKRERTGGQALRDAAVVLVLLVLFGSVRFGGPAVETDGATAPGLVPVAHAREAEPVARPVPDAPAAVQVLQRHDHEVEHATASDRSANHELTIREEVLLPAGIGRVEAEIDGESRKMSVVFVRDGEQAQVFELDLGDAAAAAERFGRRLMREGLQQQARRAARS
jgi:hypothetical protein